MTCEICDTQTATIWVEIPAGWTHPPDEPEPIYLVRQLVSCDDCGPQLGYKILSPLEPVSILSKR